MPKKDHVIYEKSSDRGSDFSGGKAALGFAFLGPLGLLAGDDGKRYSHEIGTDGGETVTGRGATPESARLDAYKNMKDD